MKNVCNPVTIPAEPDGEFHTLVAEFTGSIGVAAPVLANIASILTYINSGFHVAAIGGIPRIDIASPIVVGPTTSTSILITNGQRPQGRA